ncbi:MAG: hypothetical protein CFE21_09415 [Bacteroidetes bacterium B1(2017)]|nr:MAG: hypothetical protein CFE21_09415 [Bacteroidetes bacterium B1(2017)]
MKKLYRVILLGCVFILGITSVEASHLFGGELSYTCTATPGIYKVQAKLYKDCNDPTQICANCPNNGLSASCAIQVQVTIAGNAYYAQVPVQTNANQLLTTVNLFVQGPVVSYENVQLCNLLKTICTNCGTRMPGTYSPGMEVYTFEGDFNANAFSTSACYFSVSMNECCRKASISSPSTAPTMGLFNEVIINRCASPCNSSPQFTNPPTNIVCSGVYQMVNFGATDPDGDSLSYNLGTMLPYNPYNYLFPYSPTSPFPYLGFPTVYPPEAAPYGFHLNKSLGTLSFQPVGVFTAPLILDVYQWKPNGASPILMGISRREVTINSNICPSNYAPKVKRYSATGNALPTAYSSDSICAGASFCRTYVATDFDGADSTDFTWSLSTQLKDAGATITRLYDSATRVVNGPRADSIQLCWVAPETLINVGSYPYYLLARDRKCPVRGMTTFAGLIKVFPKPSVLVKVKKTNYKTFDFSYQKLTQTPTLLGQNFWQIETAPSSDIYTTIPADSIKNYVFTSPGIYKIKLNLSYSCGVVTVEENIQVSSTGLKIETIKNIACKGDSTGQLKLSYQSGVAPILYKFNEFAFSNIDSALNLKAGMVRVVAKDALNRYDTLFVSIEQSNFSVDFAITQQVSPTCFGQSNGQIQISPSVGKAPFLFSIDTLAPQATGLFSNLGSGQKLLSIKDSTGCTLSKTVFLTQPLPLQIVSITKESVKCFGDSNGTVSIVATGGTGDLQYSIGTKPFGSANTFINLKQGTYSITVRDSNNCQLTSSATIANASVMATLLAAKPITCYGVANASANCLVIGGVAPYTYLWNTLPAQTTNNASNLAPGWHSVLVKDSNQCAAFDSVYIEPKAYYKGDSICALSVDTSSNKPLLTWQKTLGKGIAKYYVYSRQNSLSNFVLRDSIPFNATPQFIDNLPLSNPNTRQYQIHSVDSCGQVSVASTLHQAAIISVTGPGDNRYVTLTPYVGLTGGKYLLYRSTNGAPYELLDTLSGLSYVDVLVPTGVNNYFVKYLPFSACNNELFSSIVSITVSGIAQLNSTPYGIQVYPNPVQSRFTVYTKTPMAIEGARLLSLDGKQLKNFALNNSNTPLEFDVSEFADGVYFLELSSSLNGKVSFKIVKDTK